jgi:hypothetical protein
MISSSIHVHDSRAQLIKDAAVIIWDEAPMASKAILSCVDDVCRLAMQSSEPFGGKIIILLGDFRQTCPVVRRGSKADVIQASIKSSPLWHLFHTVRLTRPIRHADDEEYATFLDAIGDGLGPDVELTILQRTQNKHELINFVFLDDILQYPLQCLTRAILAPTNRQIDDYNAQVLQHVQGRVRYYTAADSLQNTLTEDDDDPNTLPYSSVLDYVIAHPPTGLPPHTLQVKVGGVYRIMRNFSIDRGLVKNSRVVITDIGSRLITVHRLKNNVTLAHDEEDILLPRITFTSPLPSCHTLVRKQFPLAPAYATTFNSCQGLTLDRLGLDVSKPAFSHGQLYTALSRIRRRQDALVYQTDPITKNVTYKELLL